MSYRVFIYGGFCSGKTWLSKKLSDQFQVKVYHLDDIYWYGNWEHIKKEELLDQIKRIIETETDWIIEGNYRTIRDFIIPYCDFVYFCWAPLHILVARCFKRSFDRNRSGVPKAIRDNTSFTEPIHELLWNVMLYWMRHFAEDKRYLREWNDAHELQIEQVKCTKIKS